MFYSPYRIIANITIMTILIASLVFIVFVYEPDSNKRESLIAEKLSVKKDKFVYDFYEDEVLVDGGKIYKVFFNNQETKITKFVFVGYEN
ncbi:hypothetical protein IHV09_21965 [Fictibacillus sp. 23RED33]|uniref:hypothetical protein n=1 Tax=Fictibacillus sp. 23RED33 TaxID=2745879 RepID=UPI0018CDC235|nr:hypothetical protein [Fictibacillus sp. 23RED33]MBH0176226.1 hypothetical protein [Fictibacillus sp. 23RED33]